MLGQTVKFSASVSDGWVGSGNYTYQWTIDGQDKGTGASQEYTIPLGDQNAKQITVSCKVTDKNDTSITDTDAITFWQVKVNMKCNGTILGQAVRNVRVGEKISLALSFLPSAYSPNSPSYTWAIEGRTVKDYLCTRASAQYNELSSSDMQQQQVTFHWIHGKADGNGLDQHVICRWQSSDCAGSPVSVTGRFAVSAPDIGVALCPGFQFGPVNITDNVSSRIFGLWKGNNHTSGYSDMFNFFTLNGQGYDGKYAQLIDISIQESETLLYKQTWIIKSFQSGMAIMWNNVTLRSLMNTKLFRTVCITMLLCHAAVHASDNIRCVSNLLHEIATSFTTDYRRILAKVPRHSPEQRAALEAQITGALHRSYLLSQKLSALLVSNDAAAQLVACHLTHVRLAHTNHSEFADWTIHSALVAGSFRWSLYHCEALLTNTLSTYEYKRNMLDCLSWLLSQHHVGPASTQEYLRVYECIARSLAASNSSNERALVPRALAYLARSQDPLVAARGVQRAKELRASATTEADRARFTRLIVKSEEPSRYTRLLEELLESSDDNLAFEAYSELTMLEQTNNVARRAWQTKWLARRHGVPPGTNSVMRDMCPASGN